MLKRTAILAALLLPMCAGAVHAQQFVTFPGWAHDVTPDGSVVVGQLPPQTGAEGYYWRWQVDPAPVPIGGIIAVAVSDDGTAIAGNMNDPVTGQQVAGRWTAATGWVPLGGINTCTSISSAYDISGDGKRVVGLAWVGCNARGFLWTEGVGIQELQKLGSGNNRATTISAHGAVIGGFAQAVFDRTPAIWSQDTSGAVWDLNSLGEVLGLNNDGSVSVGNRFFSGNTTSAFMNSTATGLVKLGPLVASWNGNAWGLSEDGQTIVGFDTLGLARRAWLWKPADGTKSLQSRLAAAGVPNVPDLSVALACSDSGRTIVGGFGAATAYIAVLAKETWNQLGAGVPGSNGTPVMSGGGTLTPNSTASVTLTHGPSNGTGNIVVGISAINAPFKQGVLVPNPYSVFYGLPLDANGALAAAFTWPAGIPSGTSLYWQAWCADPAAAAGFSSTNGLKSTAP